MSTSNVKARVKHWATMQEFLLAKEASQVDELKVNLIEESGEVYTHGKLYKRYEWGTLGTPPDPIYNYHPYVDMGEAGIWATCNIGAENPWDYGLYFAWGETEGYADANVSKRFSWEDYKFGTENNLIKYNESDGLTILEPEDDAAHVIMKGQWKIPTKDDFQRLFDLCNNFWTPNYKNSAVKGRVFTLKTDETKELFFPAAGLIYNGSNSRDRQSAYWSSHLYYSDIRQAICLFSNMSYHNPTYTSYRYNGAPIRGFIPKS